MDDEGFIFVCYDYDKLDAKAYYAMKFNVNGIYYAGEKVYHEYPSGIKIYEAIINYDGGFNCKILSGDLEHPMGYNFSTGIDQLQNCAKKKQGTEEISTPQPFFKEITT